MLLLAQVELKDAAFFFAFRKKTIKNSVWFKH